MGGGTGGLGPADAGAAGGDAGTAAGGAGGDTTTPFPIDRGGGAGAPASYKGLSLALVPAAEPVVTPVRGGTGVVCIGMSNSNQECTDYIAKLATTFAAEVNPAVRVVNCAVGGNAIERWNDPAQDDRLWTPCVDTHLPAAGVALDQVRVVYHKAANQFTTAQGGGALPAYPDADSDYFNFIDNLTAFSARVKVKFPNLQAVYTTSRSYGGFADNPGRGEPLSYEEGHALNAWLAAHATVDGVWYGWGPYIWAPDCATGQTNASDVCYQRSDYVADGIHPGQGARDKVSRMIHARFRQHAWYRP
jgi:hypothetical protein